MSDIWGAAGLSALGSMATAAINSAGNYKSQKRAMKYSRQLQEQAQGWQEEMWRKQNLYNLPVNELQRLVDAGINPALAFSNGGGASAPVPAASAGSVGAPSLNAPNLAGAVQAAQTQQRVDNETAIAGSVIDRNTAEADKLRSESSESISRTNLNNVEFSIKSNPDYINALQESPALQNNLARLDAQMKSLDYSFSLGTYGYRMESSRLSLDQQKLNFIISAAQLRNIQATYDEIGAHIRFLDSGSEKQRAEAAVLRQDLDIRAGRALLGTLQRDAIAYCRDHGVSDPVTKEVVSFTEALADEYASKVFEGVYSSKGSAVTSNQESIYQEAHGQERRALETREIERRGNYYRTSQWNMSIRTGLDFLDTAVDIGTTFATRGMNKAGGSLITPKAGSERMLLSPEAMDVIRKVYPDVEKRLLY